MWANVVKQAAAPAAPGHAQLTSSEGCKIVVVDANAIINGIRLEGIADKAVTIQEVLDEVRDKQSRAFLASLAIKLEVSEPSEDSIKAGARAFTAVIVLSEEAVFFWQQRRHDQPPHAVCNCHAAAYDCR